MPSLSVRRPYTDGAILFKLDLDEFLDDIETLLNTTKLDDDNLQDAGITASSKLVDASISTGKIASSAVTTAKIADANVTTAKIADLNVTTAKINDLAVTTDKINDNSVTSAKIVDGAIVASKIADVQIIAAKIADLNVTTGKIADSAVTGIKRAALNSGLSNSCGALTLTNNVETSANNLSQAITSVGRQIRVSLIPDSTDNVSLITATTPTTNAIIRIKRGSTVIAKFNALNWANMPVTMITTTDAVSASTYTYTVTLESDGCSINYAKLFVEELG